MIQITKEEALRVQAEQVEFYAQRHGPQLRAMVAEATTADALEPGQLYDIAVINRHIPRGGKIESMIARMGEG